MTAPYQHHSVTSREAARSIEGSIKTLRERVFRAIKGSPVGLTAEEVELFTGIPGNTVRPRIVELYRSGQISTVGKRRTKSGRRADVWFPTQELK